MKLRVIAEDPTLELVSSEHGGICHGGNVLGGHDDDADHGADDDDADHGADDDYDDNANDDDDDDGDDGKCGMQLFVI